MYFIYIHRFGENGNENHFSNDIDILLVEAVNIKWKNNNDISGYIFEFIISDNYENYLNAIYTKHTCKYASDILPPLLWGVLNENTKSLCIIIRIINKYNKELLKEQKYDININNFPKFITFEYQYINYF